LIRSRVICEAALAAAVIHTAPGHFGSWIAFLLVMTRRSDWPDSRLRALKKIWRLWKGSAVMAALDAAIHEKHRTFNMLLDGRVKPGHDNGRSHYSYFTASNAK
jgi:hypothetical protein